jgi:hypothetical protein
MKLKVSALVASITVLTLGIHAQAKKPAKPAAPAPAAAAPAKPAEPAAAAAPAAEEAPAPVEGFFVTKIKSPVDGKAITLRLGGYVDAYYGYNYRANGDTRSNNHPQGTEGGTTAIPNGTVTNSSSPGPASTSVSQNGRVFESANNQFSLGLVQTKFEMGNEDWQVVADLIHGPNAELTNFNNIRAATSSTTSTAIKQAYVAFVPISSVAALKTLKVTAGQFSTHIGYEVVESYQNPNYMLGNLFGYGPFYHTGAKVDYSIMDGKFGVMAGAVNGWDLQADNNADKTVIGQISAKPISGLSIFLNYAGGNESSKYSTTVSNVGGMRHIGDLVVQYQVMKALKVGLNVVAGHNRTNRDAQAQQWGGAALYLTYAFNDIISLSWRTDYFEDKQYARGLLGQTGATTNGMTVIGNTLTGNISLYGGHILVRPEVKYDIADKLVYGGGTELHKTNWTALVAVTGVY